MRILFAAVLLVTDLVFGAEPKLTPINVLNRDVATAEYEIEMLQRPGDTQLFEKHLASFHDDRAKVEADLKPALAFARGHSDLAKAVKAYYLAAISYFDAAFATNAYERAAAQRAKSELDAADNAMHLEERLAGFQ